MDFHAANIPSKAISENFAEIARATRTGKRFVVTRNGRPRLALVSLDDLELLRELEDAADRRVIAKRRDEPTVSWTTARRMLGLDRRTSGRKTKS